MKDMLEHYKGYPESLHPDNLTHMFSNRLKVAIPVAGVCNGGSDVVLLDDKHMNMFLRQADVLTVIVRLQIVDDMKPRIAALSINYYRPEIDALSVQNAVSRILVVPLDLPDTQIASRVTKFVTDNVIVITANESGGLPY